MDALIIQKSRSQLKLIGAGKMAWSKFHTEDPQISGWTIQNVVGQVILGPEFLNPLLQ